MLHGKEGELRNPDTEPLIDNQRLGHLMYAFIFAFLAPSVCDALLDKGKVGASGHYENMYLAPASVYVSEFADRFGLNEALLLNLVDSTSKEVACHYLEVLVAEQEQNRFYPFAADRQAHLDAVQRVSTSGIDARFEDHQELVVTYFMHGYLPNLDWETLFQ